MQIQKLMWCCLVFGFAIQTSAELFAADGFAVAADSDKKLFRAGASAVDITPRKFPISMTGSFADRQAIGAHDKLHARCLLLDDGRTRVAIVVCDSCLISREILDTAKSLAKQSTGIPTSRMMISATHTHTAATAVALGNCRPDPEYVAFLTRQIAKSIEQAAARLVPAKVGWAVAAESSEVSNRRWFMKEGTIPSNPFGKSTDTVKMNPPRGSPTLIKPAGPIDPDVSLLSIQTADGQPLALLANYSLHYVGGITPNMVSADYFGEFARQIKQRVKGDEWFVGMMSNGTSGDINNYNFRDPRPRADPFERVTAVAAKIADVTFAAYQRIDHRTWVPLSMAEREIELAVRRPDTKELAYAQAILAKLQGPVRKTLPEVYAQETVLFSHRPATVKLKLQALRVGELGIVAEPCEAFAEIGLEIKKRSPLKPTFVIGLANGYNGYLPTPRQHQLGGYETWRSSWSYLEIDASTKIVSTLLELLRDVDD